MSNIAVDIDQTLYDFATPARDAFFRLAKEKGRKDLFRGAYLPWVEWRSPKDVGAQDWKEAVDWTHRPEVIEEQIPYPGASETLRKLSNAGHGIIYISNRSEQVADVTWSWLETWNFPTDRVLNSLVCAGDHSKLPFVRDCQYIIEDRPRTLVEFVYDREWRSRVRPRMGFGILTEYNRALTDVKGIYLAPTWAGLNYYFVEKRLLYEPAHEALGAAK